MKRLLLVLILLLLFTGIASATTSTFTAATNADGRMSRSNGNETFTALRNGAGTASDTSTAIITFCGPSTDPGAPANNYSSMKRFGWSDDTSSIPDTDTVTAATFALYGGSYKTYGLGNSTLVLVAFTPADYTSITAADYSARSLVPLATNISETAWSNTGWNTFTLNAAGLAYISKTGNTSLMLTTAWDIDNSAPTSWASDTSSLVKGYQTTGAATDPILTVTHAGGGGGGTGAPDERTFVPYPSNHIIRQPITTLPRHAQSDNWVTAMRTANGGSNVPMAADDVWVYNYVNNTVSMESIVFDEDKIRYSDLGLYAMPPVFDYDHASTDRGGLIINVDTGITYGLGYNDGRCNGGSISCVNYNGTSYPIGTWRAGGGVIWPNTTTTARSLSLSASGLNPSPGWGVVTDADILNGTINHGMAVNIQHTRSGGYGVGYIWPATHSSGTGTTMPPAGARMRLKSSVDTSGYPAQPKMVLDAMKIYGGFIVENTGQANKFIILGEEGDYAWSYSEAGAIFDGIYITDFEFVDESSLMVSPMSYAIGSSVSSFSANTTSGLSPLTVQFTDTSAGTPTNWDWYMGATEAKTSDLQNPAVSFTTGTYNIRLWTSNAIGGSWANTTTITVSAGAPVAAFSGTPVVGTEPLSVSFTDASTNSPTSWLWSYYHAGNGTYVGLFDQWVTQNPVQTFPHNGSYTIWLRATNAYGDDIENKVGYITVLRAPPVAAFTADHTTGNAPFTVVFSDQSTYSPTTWAWDFGDGTTSALQNPSHTYAGLGTFTVSLTATNAGGTDIESKSGYISVVAYPVITYTPTPTPLPTAPSTGPGSHPRQMAATVIPTIPNEHYLPILGMLAMGEEETTAIPNWSALPLELMGVYTDYMGPIAFLIIFLIPFGMMWLAHGNMKLLAILGLITCGFVFLYLPATYQAAAIMCMLVSIAAGLWGLFKQ
jgi:PKD repeat protein